MLSQELNDSKYKLLELVEEKIQLEKDKVILISKIDVLNEDQLVLEKEREEKERNK